MSETTQSPDPELAMPSSLHNIFKSPRQETKQDGTKEEWTDKPARIYVSKTPEHPTSFLIQGLVLLLATLILVGPTIGMFVYFPEYTVDDVWIGHWTLLAAFGIIGYFVGRFVVTLLIYILNRRVDPSDMSMVSLVYWTSECKEYLSFSIYLVVLQIMVNFSPTSNSNQWATHAETINKLLFGAFLGIFVFAYKKYLVKKMSMSFNHANYIERMLDCLFVDRMLRLLGKLKSKHKKDRGKITRKEQSVWDQVFRVFGSFKDNVYRDMISKDYNMSVNVSTVRTVSDLNGLDPYHVRGAGDVQPDLLISPFDIERGLTSFRKMANRIVGLSPTNFFGKDWHMEIRKEAYVLAQRIMKRVIPPEEAPYRSYMIKSDVETMIGNRMEVNRFWNMVVDQEVFDSGYDREKTKTGLFEQSGTYEGEKLRSMQKEDPFRKPGGEPSKGTQGVTEKELVDFIEKTYREIVGLFKSLDSMEAAVEKLDIFFGILSVAILMVFLALLFGDLLAALTSLSSLIFGAAFMFGSSAKNVFESIIFLFVTHPFDVGDRVYLSLSPPSGPAPNLNIPGYGASLTNASPSSGHLENLVVSEMHLITTLFERWDGAKMYIPNHMLAMKPIINVRRSGALLEAHRIQVAFDTSVQVLNEIKQRTVEFVKRESYDYTSNVYFNVETIENCNRIHLVIMVQHRTNWQDLEMQMLRKSKILMFLKETCENLGVVYHPPIQRVEMVGRR